MITRRLIFCVLLMAASGLSVSAEEFTAQARQSFDQMLLAGTKGMTDQQIDTTLADLKAALRTGEQIGECEAMLATVYGFELTRRPWKALWLGPKIRSLYRSALCREPENARVHYLAGIGFLKAPEKFRDLAEAEHLLRRAKDLYDRAGDQAGFVKTCHYLDELAAIKKGEAEE